MEGEDESPAPNATCEAAGLNSEDEEVDDNSSDYYNKTSHSFMVIICFVPPIIPTFKSCLYILKGSEGICIFRLNYSILLLHFTGYVIFYYLLCKKGCRGKHQQILNWILKDRIKEQMTQSSLSMLTQ